MEDDKKFVAGCLGMLALGLVLASFVWVYSCISSIGEPTKEEEAAELAAADKQLQEETQRTAAFQQSQTPLWQRAATDLTQSRVMDEISKCKRDIERDGSPYAWMYDPVDPKEALATVGDGRPVSLTVVHRLDMPFGDENVEWATYNCWFKGAGYERVVKSADTHYTKEYPPEL